MQLPLGTKRLVFLSGMSAAEVQEVISAYRDSGWSTYGTSSELLTVSVVKLLHAR